MLWVCAHRTASGMFRGNVGHTVSFSSSLRRSTLLLQRQWSAAGEPVNTTPQMTYFLGAKRVHKITTGKSYDELLQHDNKMRIWARSENSEKWKNL